MAAGRGTWRAAKAALVHLIALVLALLQHDVQLSPVDALLRWNERADVFVRPAVDGLAVADFRLEAVLFRIGRELG